jgi:hypothetical protein
MPKQSSKKKKRRYTKPALVRHGALEKVHYALAGTFEQ